MVHLLAYWIDSQALIVINDIMAILALLFLLGFIIKKQSKLVSDLNKALFFHQLVNKTRVIKYFVMNDLWIIQLLTLYVLVLCVEIDVLDKGEKNSIYLLAYFFVGCNPINLLIKWTIVSFEDFQILLIELHSRINMLSSQLVINHDSEKNQMLRQMAWITSTTEVDKEIL